LPLTGNVSLSVTNIVKNWSGNWLKFIGGSGDLSLQFSTLKSLNFKVPYIVEDSGGSYDVKFLTLDKNGNGEIDLNKFGTDYKSLTIIPSLQSLTYMVDDTEPTFPFTYKVGVAGAAKEEQDLIQKLLDQITYLQQEIAKLKGGNSSYCSQLDNNLSIGMSGNQVKCLQQFLKNQGLDIYPQGYVTGFFGNLTRLAVIKFQEKFATDILMPFGLQKGTGYVGSQTRQKINQILNGA
jgi:hypothetical protein